MQRVIVTGSSGLFGSQITKHLKSKSYKIICCDLKLGHDLSDEDFTKDFFKRNKAEYLVNLFALNDHVEQKSKRQSLFEVGLESFRQFMELNVTTLFSACREFAKNKEAKGIINFSSTYGLVSPLPRLYKQGEKHIGYSVSKGAVIQLTKHLAAHLAPRVRVNCIAPGGAWHKQAKAFIEEYGRNVPLGRMMKKNELNKLVEYMCSEGSSYMTGAVIVIDGGWTAW